MLAWNQNPDDAPPAGIPADPPLPMTPERAARLAAMDDCDPWGWSTDKKEA